jgi:hypothetical protein
VRRGDSRPSLKATVQGFKALQGVKQLHASVPHCIARLTKLIGVPEGELDPIYSDSGLICHLKFDSRRARRRVGFDGRDNLMHDF